MAIKIPYYLVSHHRKVANVYKKWLRHLEGQHNRRDTFRYEARLARAEFDAIYYQKDIRISKEMLLEKEEEFSQFIAPPITFPTSPDQLCYDREFQYEDFVLDFWHPLEKAVYPEYFARRELRKQQYLEMWNRQHGPPKPQQ